MPNIVTEPNVLHAHEIVGEKKKSATASDYSQDILFSHCASFYQKQIDRINCLSAAMFCKNFSIHETITSSHRPCKTIVQFERQIWGMCRKGNQMNNAKSYLTRRKLNAHCTNRPEISIVATNLPLIKGKSFANIFVLAWRDSLFQFEFCVHLFFSALFSQPHRHSLHLNWKLCTVWRQMYKVICNFTMSFF